VRALLARNVDRAALAADGPWRLCEVGTGLVLKQASGRFSGEASAAAGGMRLGRLRLSAKEVRLESDGQKAVSLNGKRYRGDILIRRRSDDGLDIINECNPEDYLLGTLPAEVAASWPMDALMAQAVALRSYVVHAIRSEPDKAYHLSATSAAYRGADKEHARTTEAARRTRGLVLVWNKKYFPAYFHSTCGGHTADAGKVFGGASIPPLSGVRCPFCRNSPHARWSDVVVRKSELAGALRDAGYPVTNIERITTYGARGGDDHAAGVLINGDVRIEANKFRMIIGAGKLKSTAFSVHVSGDSLVFSGSGWGHGVGMCQYGACRMAREGYNWKQILAYYYPSAKMLRVYDDPDKATIQAPR